MRRMIVRTGAFRRPSIPPRVERARSLTLHDEGGKAMWSAPFSPQQIEHGGQAPSYTDAERDGLPPLLLRASDPRPTLRFDLLLAYTDIERSVEPWLNSLRYIAARPHRIRIAYGPSESAGLWRLTEMTYTSSARNQHGDITRATVQVGFTRATDATIHRGPLTGGAKPPAGAAPAATRTSAPRAHIVKRGETLSGISVRYYRTPTRWRQIADHNGIRDPKRLRVGTRLVIP